jgi:hypothetical protein
MHSIDGPRNWTKFYQDVHAAQVPVGALRESLHKTAKILTFTTGFYKRMQSTDCDGDDDALVPCDIEIPPVSIRPLNGTEHLPPLSMATAATPVSHLQTPTAIPGACGVPFPIVEKHNSPTRQNTVRTWGCEKDHDPLTVGISESYCTWETLMVKARVCWGFKELSMG